MARRQRPCTDCGRLLNVGKGSLPEPTCRECRRKRPHRQVVTSICPTCGKEFSRLIQQTYCSIECSNKRHRPERVGDPNAAAARKMRRTVRCRERRLRHALTWDGITDAEIWERDGWRCQVPECLYRSRKINQRYKYPDPRSPGIDHIVPLSRGGDDTCVNKRAAHHGCNMARGNRMGHEQLLLIGSLREPPLMTEVAGTVRERRKPKPPKPPKEPKLPKMRRCPCGKDFPARQAGRGDRCPACWWEVAEKARRMRAGGMQWREIAEAFELCNAARAYTVAHSYWSAA